jgi:hypothetical protein
LPVTPKQRVHSPTWNAIRTKRKASYAVFRKSCSTIVSRVLHAGGFCAKKWVEDNNWVWAPSDIRRRALSAHCPPNRNNGGRKG